MTIAEVLTIIIGLSGFLSALSIIYTKLIKPIKKLVSDLEKSKNQVVELEKKLKAIYTELQDDLKAVKKELQESSDFDNKNLGITLKSIIAILDGLEQNGANGKVTKTKKELILYMSKHLSRK